MADDTDVLLKILEQYWGYLHQSENQRAQITNMVLIIASAAIGFIAQRGTSLDALPLSLLLVGRGIFGAVSSAKLYERYSFWVERSHALEKKIDALHPGAEIIGLQQRADLEHAQAFTTMSRVRLHHLWLILHLAIASAGLVLTLVIVFVR